MTVWAATTALQFSAGGETVDIYTLSDPRTDEPFYIGASTAVKTRFKTHIHAARRVGKDGDGALVKERIRTILDAGCRPILTVLEPDADSTRERVWVRRLKAAGEKLLNKQFAVDRSPEEICARQRARAAKHRAAYKAATGFSRGYSRACQQGVIACQQTQ